VLYTYTRARRACESVCRYMRMVHWRACACMCVCSWRQRRVWGCAHVVCVARVRNACSYTSLHRTFSMHTNTHSLSRSHTPLSVHTTNIHTYTHTHARALVRAHTYTPHTTISTHAPPTHTHPHARTHLKNVRTMLLEGREHRALMSLDRSAAHDNQ